MSERNRNYWADVRVDVRPVPGAQTIQEYEDAENPFDKRDVDFEVLVTVPDRGSESSAHAVVAALAEAHEKAAKAIEGSQP